MGGLVRVFDFLEEESCSSMFACSAPRLRVHSLADLHCEACGQPGHIYLGRLHHSISLKPVGGATVLVEGTKLQTRSAADGAFAIANVAPGRITSW